MPYDNFLSSVRCLDTKRLGKQRLECYQMIHLLLDREKKAWRRHPAFVMWQGYSQALVAYFFICCNEFRARGYRENLARKMLDEASALMSSPNPATGPNTAAIVSIQLFKEYEDLDVTKDYLPKIAYVNAYVKRPVWVDHPLSISGYRSNLLRKDPKHYGQFGWTEPPDLEYFWGGLLKLKRLLGKNYKHYYLVNPPGISYDNAANDTSGLSINFSLDFLKGNNYFRLSTSSDTVSYFANGGSTDFQRIPSDKFSKIVSILKECRFEEEIRKVLDSI